MRLPINFRLLYTLLSALVVILGTLIVIKFAQGDRLTLTGDLQSTGLLSANSFPPGAELHINGRLTSATDTTINLEPNEYQIEIRKDGYSPWRKKLKIQEGLVTQTNAQLYRQVPSLTPLTIFGAKNVVPAPDGQKLVFYTASAASSTRNGLYVLELMNGLLPGVKEPRQISDEVANLDLNTAQLIWSPDSNQVLVKTQNRELLLDISKKTQLNTALDISLTHKQLISDWQTEIVRKERQYLANFPVEIIRLATSSAKNVYLSPDKKRLFYTATASLQLPPNLIPPLPATNTQPESRQLEAGLTYVYDLQEDKNFLLDVPPVATASAKWSDPVMATSAAVINNQNSASVKTPARATTSLDSKSDELNILDSSLRDYYLPLYTTNLQWLPDSRHLVFSRNHQIVIKEYDNTNDTPIFAGQAAEQFVYPWPDGSKLIILTSFATDSPLNLYAVEIK